MKPTFTLIVLKCLKCGAEWFPRKPERPRRCPKCWNCYWDKAATK